MARVLIVDDSRAMRMILSKALRKLGFAVVETVNGRDALECMEREGGSIDFIMVDWNMPEVNGLEFVCRLRAQPGYRDIPIVMVTTETEIEQMSRALEAGANEYLMKPFTPEAIADKLRIVGVLA